MSSEPALGPRSELGNYFYPALIAIVVAGVYATSFWGVFVFDDGNRIVNEEAIRSFPPEGGILTSRSLVTYSLALNYALTGLEVGSYHSFNLAVHLVSSLALFGLARRLFARQSESSLWHQKAEGLATIAALLWAVHPLQTQSVTYIIQRSESMMGMFYLLTLYCVVRSDESQGKWSLGWGAASIGCCAAGMKCKEVMVTAPFVAIFLDRVYLSPSWKSLVRKRWALHLGLLATLALLSHSILQTLTPPTAPAGVSDGAAGGTGTLGGSAASQPSASAGIYIGTVSATEYALSQPGVILQYLRLTLIPYPQCLDYDWPVARSALEIGLPSAVLIGLLTASCWMLVRFPKAGFLCVAFFVVLAPTSSFVPILDLAFEHRMYLPLACLAILATIGGSTALEWAEQRKVWDPSTCKSAGLIAAVGAILLFSLTTMRRNYDYRSEEAIWKTVLDQRPENARAHFNLATAFGRKGLHKDALEHFRIALDLHSDADTHFGLGESLDALGRWQEAISQYQKAIKLKPDYWRAHFSLGTLYSLRNRLPEAETHLREAVRFNPKYGLAYSNLARVLNREGKLDEAIAAYENGVRAEPGLALIRSNYGLALARRGKIDDAVVQFQEAVRIDPNYLKAYHSWGSVLVDAGRADEAIPIFGEAIRLKPRDPGPRYGLAHALHTLGRKQEATNAYAEAMKVGPTWPKEAAAAAWRLATHPNPYLRDGHESLRLAQQLNQPTGYQDPYLLDVEAAALAELGKFSEASSMARDAAFKARASGRADVSVRIEEHLKAYDGKQAYRDDSLAKGS